MSAMDLTEGIEEYTNNSPMQNDSVLQSFPAMTTIDAFREMMTENDSRSNDSNVPESRECTWDYIECEYPAESYTQSEVKENYDEGRQQETRLESLAKEKYLPQVSGVVSMQNSLSQPSEASYDSLVKGYGTYPQRWQSKTRNRVITDPVLGVLVPGTKKSKRGEKRRLKRRVQGASKCFVMDVDELFNDQLDSPLNPLERQPRPRRIRDTLEDFEKPVDNEFNRTICVRRPKPRKLGVLRSNDFCDSRLADIMETTGLDSNLLDPQCFTNYTDRTELGFPYEAEFHRSNHSLSSEGEVRSCIFCAENKRTGEGSRYTDLVDCRYFTNRPGQRDSSCTISSRKCTPSKASLFVEVGQSCAQLSNLSFPSSTSFLDQRGERVKSTDSTGRLRNLLKREYMGNPMRIISKTLLGEPSGSCNPDCTTRPSRDKAATHRGRGDRKKRRSLRNVPAKSPEREEQDWRENSSDKNASATASSSFSIEDQSVRSDTDSMEYCWARKVAGKGRRQNASRTKDKGLSCRKSLEEMDMRSSKFIQQRKRTKIRMTDKTSQTKYDVHVNTSTKHQRSEKVEQSFWGGLQGVKILTQVQDICKNFLLSTMANVNNIFKGSTRSKRSYSNSARTSKSKTRLADSSRSATGPTHVCRKNSNAMKPTKDEQTSYSSFAENSYQEFPEISPESTDRYFEEKYEDFQKDVESSSRKVCDSSGARFCPKPCGPLTRESSSKNSEHQNSREQCRKDHCQERRPCLPPDEVKQCSNVEDEFCRRDKEFPSDFLGHEYRSRGGADENNIPEKDKADSAEFNDNQVEGLTAEDEEVKGESSKRTTSDLVSSEEETTINCVATLSFKTACAKLGSELDFEVANLIIFLVKDATQQMPMLSDVLTLENITKMLDEEWKSPSTEKNLENQSKRDLKSSKKKLKVPRTAQSKGNLMTSERNAKTRQSTQPVSSPKRDSTSSRMRSDSQGTSLAKDRTTKSKKKVDQKRKKTSKTSVEKDIYCQIVGTLQIICVDDEGKEVTAEIRELCFCKKKKTSRPSANRRSSKVDNLNPLRRKSSKKNISIQTPESITFIPETDSSPLLDDDKQAEKKNSQQSTTNPSPRKRWSRLSNLSSETTVDAGSTTMVESKSSMTLDIVSSDLLPDEDISHLPRTISTTWIECTSSKFWDCPFVESKELVESIQNADTMEDVDSTRDAVEEFPKHEELEDPASQSNTISADPTAEIVDQERSATSDEGQETTTVTENNPTAETVDQERSATSDEGQETTTATENNSTAETVDQERSATSDEGQETTTATEKNEIDTTDSAALEDVESSSTKSSAKEEGEEVLPSPGTSDDAGNSGLQDGNGEDLTSVVRTFGTIMGKILAEHSAKDEKGRILMNIRIEATTDYKTIRKGDKLEESISSEMAKSIEDKESPDD